MNYKQFEQDKQMIYIVQVEVEINGGKLTKYSSATLYFH